VTHVAHGEARVEQVAPTAACDWTQWQVGKMRGSSCRDAELIALPEGLIDPLLKTVAFIAAARSWSLATITPRIR